MSNPKNKPAGEKLSTFQQVRDLPKKQAVAFSAGLLQRMLPNYVLFSEVCEFGDAEYAKKLLDLIWEWLLAPKSKINIAVQLEKLEEITPDIENFDNYGVYPALDFCMAATACLQLICDEEENGAVMVAKLSQGGVEAYLLALSDVDLSNQEIKADPLMQYEIEMQMELLSLCKQSSFKELRKQIKELEMSNIGISLNN
ncbi:YjaG family protein [Glaciecola sp. MH2013]|uniref:YjaG family protein n=1 Tax=Glaciecola sp. MH2013 TaxID=2785524 RepID=UPI0018A0F430|nr:YjaG family protein [Glaciecola sp. MH2013]MBF7073835.1 YjaG family protein [Glaciecola sp. MH2013]